MHRRDFALGMAAAAAIAAAPAAVMASQADDLDVLSVMPDLLFLDHCDRTERDNTVTIRYRRMMRLCRRRGGELQVECARVGSERYAQWLAERDDGKPYPPHIVFGGAVVAGKGGPDFFSRWEAYAATLS